MDWSVVLGVAAVASGGGGAGLAVVAVKRARRESADECDELLRKARHDHEIDARALHWYRITYTDVDEPDWPA